MTSGDEENPWESQKVFRLSSFEYDFLNGDSTSYSKSEMENRIQQKVKLLPNRFESLYLDIERLDEEGYLENDEIRQELITAIGQINNDRSDKAPRELVSASGPDFQPDSPATRVGGRLGSLVTLVLDEDALARHDVRRHIIWGFLKTLWIRDPYASSHEELEDDFAALSNFLNRAFAELAEEVREDRERLGQREEVARSLKEHVIDILERSTLGPLEQLSDDKMQDAVASFVIASYLETEVDTESESLQNQWDSFVATADLEGFDVTAELTKSDVEQLLQRTRALEFVEKVDRIKQDLQRITERTFRGVPAEPVFSSIFEQPGISSKEIKDEITSDNLSGITRMAKDMAGRERDRGEVFAERPLVEGDKNGWEVTDYGKLVGTVMFGGKGACPRYMTVDMD